MIILGDVAAPTKELVQKLDSELTQLSSIFKDKQILINLEGLLSDENHLETNHPILYNDSSICAVLAKHNIHAALANNHTLDLASKMEFTQSELNKNGIKSLGAGKSVKEANTSISISDDDKEVVILNSCWDFLLYHQQNPTESTYVNIYDPIKILQEIKSIKESKPKAKIIIYLHWSFDLEKLPFPMYRQWAKDTIDAGADVVVGCHSHCVQGGEVYADGTIIYGLGNFFIPSGVFANGTLNFPDISNMQMALEVNFNTNEVMCHWFDFKRDSNKIDYLKSEKIDFENSTLNEYSGYKDLDNEEFIAFYKKNRRKKAMIPVLADYKKVRLNQLIVAFLKVRGKFARVLAKLGLISWQN